MILVFENEKDYTIHDLILYPKTRIA